MSNYTNTPDANKDICESVGCDSDAVEKIAVKVGNKKNFLKLLTMTRKVTISLPDLLAKKIDNERGDVTRSHFIKRLLVDKILNQLLVDRGRQIGAFAYASDDPPYSDFSYLSLIPRGYGCQIGISTSGRSPIMARRIRIKAERALYRMFNHDLSKPAYVTHISNRSKNYTKP